MKKILDTFRRKWAEYLLEIMVIMIGILGAFSLNTWNENLKLQREEMIMLTSFRESLLDDLNGFQRPLLENQRQSNSMQILIETIERDLPYHDSLKYHFGNSTELWAGRINESVFETLQSKGLSLISNEQLRRHIINLYGVNNSSYMSRINDYRKVLLDGSNSILITRFEEFWKGPYKQWNTGDDKFDGDNYEENYGYYAGYLPTQEMIPLDFEKLKQDHEYLYFLKTSRNLHYWWMERNIKSMHASLKSLLEEVEIEIEERA